MTVNSGVCAGPPDGLRDVDEHVAREQAVPGVLGDDPHRQPVARVGAGVAVLHEESATLHVVEQALPQRVEMMRLERPIDLAPPDLVGARRLADDELVVRGSAGVLTGPADERSVDGDRPFPALDRFLVQRRNIQVPVDPGNVGDAVALEASRLLLRLCHPRNRIILDCGLGIGDRGLAVLPATDDWRPNSLRALA